ncbi:hypothetical protein NPIL_626261 [Nephila pilipes]|uniref:Uncharacterized protein n=1 Tax=Nephila pilipes TaxID=299642 RepID=A0A8X6PK12_NEPPI|nr:hypothetical protein NPIL_626261 [Nephila pilipes]
MSDFMNFEDFFEEVDLPVPLSPLQTAPVSSPRPMSPAEIPELYFGKSVEESPERSLAESVAQSLEPCSTEPRAASPQPGPSMAKPSIVSVVQRKTDPKRRKRSRSKEEKKSSKRRRTNERKSSDRSTSPDPRSQEARPIDHRSQEARPHDPRSQEVRLHEPRSQEVRPHDPRSPEARPRDFKTPTRHIPAFGRRFLPSSWEEARPQIFFHHHGMAVFSCRDDGFTLTNGVVSYASNQWCVKTLTKCLTYIDIGTVCVTDARSKLQFRAFQNSLPILSPWKRLTLVMPIHGKEEQGSCPYCNRNECHHWLATQGMSTLLHFPIHPIYHT